MKMEISKQYQRLKQMNNNLKKDFRLIDHKTLLNDKNISKNKTLELNSQLEEVKRIQENIERKLKI